MGLFSSIKENWKLNKCLNVLCKSYAEREDFLYDVKWYWEYMTRPNKKFPPMYRGNNYKGMLAGDDLASNIEIDIIVYIKAVVEYVGKGVYKLDNTNMKSDAWIFSRLISCQTLLPYYKNPAYPFTLSPMDKRTNYEEMYYKTYHMLMKLYEDLKEAGR